MNSKTIPKSKQKAAEKLEPQKNASKVRSKRLSSKAKLRRSKRHSKSKAKMLPRTPKKTLQSKPELKDDIKPPADLESRVTMGTGARTAHSPKTPNPDKAPETPRPAKSEDRVSEAVSAKAAKLEIANTITTCTKDQHKAETTTADNQTQLVSLECRSEALVINATQVIGGDKLTQSATAGPKTAEVGVSADDKTKPSKLELSEKKTPKMAVRGGTVASGDSRSVEIKSNNATKCESMFNLSPDDNRRMVDLNSKVSFLGHSEEAEKKTHSDSKSQSTQHKVSGERESLFAQKSKSDCKRRGEPPQKRLAEQIMQEPHESRRKQSLLEMNGVDPRSLVRKAPQKCAPLKENLKHMKRANAE